VNIDRKNKLIQYWKNGKDQDYESAKEIIKKTSRYLNGLFFLHLSIEKGLKEQFVRKNEIDAPLTHNLLFLAEKSQFNLTVEQRKFLVTVNEFNLETRYPSETSDLYERATFDYANNLLIQAEEFLNWISKN
jgi:hypothetical protein